MLHNEKHLMTFEPNGRWKNWEKVKEKKGVKKHNRKEGREKKFYRAKTWRFDDALNVNVILMKWLFNEYWQQARKIEIRSSWDAFKLSVTLTR